ncbi:hypothetical protein H8356DRAFT_1348405 [Neocallimastix lanati (nom. inval.)]|nr:hypothetical protein H8356DRAFT_1348405 [Neocallimastix sp. JGI-2020a]
MCPCRYILLNCNLSANYAIAREVILKHSIETILPLYKEVCDYLNILTAPEETEA